jgi:hypothetical protein
MLRGQFSERCAPSPRNPARDQIGTPRAITSESAVLEPGYLNQAVFRRGEDRFDHIASVTMFYRF